MGGGDQLLHFGVKETKEISIHAFFNDSVDQYEITLQPTSLGGLAPIEEVAYFWKKNEYSAPYRKALATAGSEAAISQDASGGVVSHVKSALKSWRVYHFHDTSASSPMKQVSEIDDNRFLRSDGSNIASLLYRFKVGHEQEYKLIRNTIRRIAPFFDDFVLEARALDETRIRLEWRHNNSDAFFDVSSFSDGTLRFIALATLLLQPKALKPSIILLDEPELGLHPSAITVLGAMIRTAAVDAQIIISTQSPMLLDLFEPEEVIVVERDSESTKLSRLNSSDLAEWLGEYSLGELWEKNELGGKPRGN
jgi:predicted ATPase